MRNESATDYPFKHARTRRQVSPGGGAATGAVLMWFTSRLGEVGALAQGISIPKEGPSGERLGPGSSSGSVCGNGEEREPQGSRRDSSLWTDHFLPEILEEFNSVLCRKGVRWNIRTDSRCGRIGIESRDVVGATSLEGNALKIRGHVEQRRAGGPDRMSVAPPKEAILTADRVERASGNRIPVAAQAEILYEKEG